MASLTETAYYARQSLKYGAVGFVAILILYWTGGGLIRLWQATHPEPPPPPAAGFGALPAPDFPQAKASVANWQLETPTGSLGTFPDRLKVFASPAKTSSFLAGDNAARLAARLGFVGQPTLETSTLYRWSAANPLPSALEMDIINTHFTLIRAWSADPALITSKRFINDQQTILDARTFLSTGGLMATDLLGAEKVTYLRAQGDQFTPAISLSEADFVKVDFFRTLYTPPSLTLSPTTAGRTAPAAVESYAFFTPDPNQGIVSVVVSGTTDTAKKIIEVNYRYTPVEYESFSDYPLKRVEQAWEELQTGGGFVAGFSGTSGQGVVRRVALGYFDPLTPHEYIMPVYVFTGDDNLVAYVSAISPELIQRAATP